MATYDVFISYRRDGGGAEARLIQAALQARNVHAFLDVTELGRGYFDDALLRNIEQTPNFVVILSPHALDRAESDEDWLRREIAHALKSDRNVVPLIMPGFQFPAKLPRDLKNLPRHQGMDYSHLYFDAMIQKLVATLDLSASDGERAKQEQAAREREERDRAEHAQLDDERQKLVAARLSAERMKMENDARRRSLELQRQAEHQRRDDVIHRRERDPAQPRWSDRFRLGDPTTTTETRQAALVAFWALLAASFGFLVAASGSEAQGLGAAGVALLAVAVWSRVSPRQASMSALVLAVVATIGMLGAALVQGLDRGRLSLALLSAGAALALWRLSRVARPAVVLAPIDGPASTQVPAPVGAPSAAVAEGSRPFGYRFAALIGVGERVDVPRLRLFIGARLAAGLAYWWAVQASQGFFSSFRLNYLWVIWVSAALPLAFATTFRWLKSPPIAIAAAAVLASVVDPVFYQGGLATLTVAGNLFGAFLFATAIEEIDDTRAAIWLATVAANIGGALIGWLWGVRYNGWNQSGSNLARLTLLCLVFTLVFAGAIAFNERSSEAPAS